MKPKVTGLAIVIHMAEEPNEIGPERIKEMCQLAQLMSVPCLLLVKIYVWIFCW